VAAQEKKIDEAGRRRPDHEGAGNGAQGTARRPCRGTRQRAVASRRRPEPARVLAGLRLPARATTGFLGPRA
jgi:hypothetical protein